MSAFNNSKYNLARYNIEAPSGDIWLNGASKVSFGFSFRGIDLFFYGNSVVNINSNSPVFDKGRIPRGNSSVEITSSADALRHVCLASRTQENFSSNVVLGQKAYVSGSSEENIDSDSTLGQEVYIAKSYSESFDIEKMILGEIAYIDSSIGEIFQATADVVSLTQYICDFKDLVLKPGQVLIIDSGSYNVLLDGENAIYLQSGDWFDNLTRETQNITISGTNATKLTASILYTERYL